MKVLIVSITPKSAVDRLSEKIKKYNPHIDITILPFHPKRFSKRDLATFKHYADKVDLIHFQYYKSAIKLLEIFPELKDKATILTLHNPYAYEDYWKKNLNSNIKYSDFTNIVVKNETQQKEVPNSILIRHGIDLNEFKFNENYCPKSKGDEKGCRSCSHKCHTVGMVAFRIEKNKGIKEVAQACKELGYKFILVGHVSKASYFKELMEVNPDIDFREDISDEKLKQAYKDMAVLVCNSRDGFESGTMPILEAMAIGTPVLTRYVGLVPDAYNTVNMMLRRGAHDDIKDLKNSLRKLMSNRKLRLRIREAAWTTVRNYDIRRMARKYSWVYNRTLYPYHPKVSIVTATYNRAEEVTKIIFSLEGQTYQNIELIVCDDNSTDLTESFVKQCREKVGYPIKYINTNKDGYNLAMARNIGAIEAEGDYIMFLDSRLVPEKDAVEKFIERINDFPKSWVFGDKGAHKDSFVENFSMINRDAFIRAGMCNERIDQYGGMSQELRERFKDQGFRLVYVPQAKAKEIKRAMSKSSKRDSIVEMKHRIWKMNLGKNR